METCLTCVVVVQLSIELRSPDETSLHHLHLHGLHLFLHAVKLGLVEERGDFGMKGAHFTRDQKAQGYSIERDSFSLMMD